MLCAFTIFIEVREEVKYLDHFFIILLMLDKVYQQYVLDFFFKILELIFEDSYFWLIPYLADQITHFLVVVVSLFLHLGNC